MPFIGTQPEVGGYSVLDALTASATASYTLQKDSANFIPNTANQLLVSLNGVIQKPGSSFTVSGSTLTFSSALTSSDSIDFIIAMGEPLLIGTPSDGTVSTSKIADDAVTGAKIENNPTIAGNLTVSGNIQKTGDLTVDVAGDIILDADGADVKLSDGGTVYGELTNAASYLRIKNPIQDQDIEFVGNDGGSAITALRFDMSDAGRAVFNAGVSLGGNDAAHTLDDYEEGTWTPNCATAGVSGSYSIQLGRYIKIGNLVQCIFNLTTSGSYTGSTSSVFQLGGLPFASKYYDGSLYAGGNIGYYFNINTVDTVKQIVYQIPSGSASAFELKGTADNSGEISIVVSNFNSNSVIRGQLVYHTA